MKIKERVESRERCAESGWYAYDYIFDEEIRPDFIRSLRPLGNFVQLSMLAKPFFKIESDYFFIKGIQGEDFFRIAVHDEHRDKLEEVESFLTGVMNQKTDLA